MAAHDSSYFSPRAVQPDNARSITRNLRNLPVAAPIRTKYLYCNMMFTVAAYLVEVKSQQTFSDFLRERFFKPLGMRSTSLQPESARSTALKDRMATGYHWNKDSATYHGFQISDCPEGQGAGSIITSVNDFIKWVKALMNREDPFNEEVYQGLVRMRSFPNPAAWKLRPYTSPAIYAAGLEIYYYRGSMVVGHNGVVPGFTSRFFFLPGFQFGAVILANSVGGASVASILAHELINEVFGVPEAERSKRNRSKTGPGAGEADIIGGDENQSQKQFSVKERPSARRKGQDERKNKPKVQQTRNSRVKNPQPQETSLDAYTGEYWHPGYRFLTVEIKANKLFIDPTNRSMGFTLTFDHVCEQTQYTAQLKDFLDGGVEPIPAEFTFEDGKAMKMGLHLEPALKEMIWFQRM